MLTFATHDGGIKPVEEVLFSTPFNYMFPELAHSPACLLPAGQETVRGLVALGDAMAADDPGTSEDLNSTIPSFFTYFGQFIDHDLTARTDRETFISEIFNADGGPLAFAPRPPSEVVATLRNGRRPQLDLDSVYGDGPGLHPMAESNAEALYDGAYKFKLQAMGKNGAGPYDLWRESFDAKPNPRTALIADARNDENINISQLHAAFLGLHNAIMDGIAALDPVKDKATAYARARQMVRWVYQYLVVEHYLRTICMGSVLDDVLRNGPLFYGPVAGGEPLFMPLEFSVAGFRFGHSMIRGSYKLRGTDLELLKLLGVARPDRPGNMQILVEVNGRHVLKPEFTVDWGHFVGKDAANKARKLDTLIAKGFGTLPMVPLPGTFMAHLAKRNLVRGYSLSIPTAQAVGSALGVKVLSAGDIRKSEKTEAIRKALDDNGFAEKTPLWYYILREADVIGEGNRLGVVGSRIVAETIVGLLKADPNSYIRQFGVARNIQKGGIEVPLVGGRKRIGSIAGFLAAAGVYPGGLGELADAPERGGLCWNCDDDGKPAPGPEEAGPSRARGGRRGRGRG